MKRLILVVVLAVGLAIPVAASAIDAGCPDPAEFTARYGFTPQEYVQRVAIAELDLTAEKRSQAAVLAGNQTIDRWSDAYGTQMGLPILQYGDLYFQARMVEFRDGEIGFSAALSYLGATSNALFGCGFVDGEQVRASLQGVEAAVVAPLAPAPIAHAPDPTLAGPIARLRTYIGRLQACACDPDKLALYQARLTEYLAR